MVPCKKCSHKMTENQSYCPRCGGVSPRLRGRGKLFVPLDRIVPYSLLLAAAGLLAVVLGVLLADGQPVVIGIGAAVLILGIVSMTKYNEAVSAARDYIRENDTSPEGEKCVRCGATLEDGASYCTFCGSRNLA